MLEDVTLRFAAEEIWKQEERNMGKYLRKGLPVFLLVMGLLVMTCLNDTLYAAAKRASSLEVSYTGDGVYDENDVRKEDFRVVVHYEDGDYDVLGTREYEIEIRHTSEGYEARISYGNLWERVLLNTAGDDEDIDGYEKTLLSISATYNGDPLPVGSIAIRRDFTVKATYRVYYPDNRTGRVTRVLEDGWVLEAHTITSGDNDLTITYSENGIRRTCNVIVPSAGTSGNWVSDGDTWRFRYDDGTYLIGDWLKSGGKWYYMDEYGYMLNRVKTNLDGATYYFDETGVMQTGWVYLGRDWYFFGNDGKMQKGWVFTGGNWYYMDNEGIMLKDWLFLNNKWYFFDSDGKMQTGWLHRSYTWFFLNDSGEMQTGWVYTGGKWYFMDHGGAMLTNTWVGNHYVDGSGVWTQTR